MAFRTQRTEALSDEIPVYFARRGELVADMRASNGVIHVVDRVLTVQ